MQSEEFPEVDISTTSPNINTMGSSVFKLCHLQDINGTRLGKITQDEKTCS